MSAMSYRVTLAVCGTKPEELVRVLMFSDRDSAIAQFDEWVATPGVQHGHLRAKVTAEKS